MNWPTPFSFPAVDPASDEGLRLRTSSRLVADPAHDFFVSNKLEECLRVIKAW